MRIGQAGRKNTCTNRPKSSSNTEEDKEAENLAWEERKWDAMYGDLLTSESSEGKEEEENDRATADPGDPEWNKEVTTDL